MLYNGNQHHDPGWKSFWYGVLCQAADIFLPAPTPFKAWLHDKMGFRDSVSVLLEKEVYEADLSAGSYGIREEGSPFELVNNAVKASTGKELSSEAYRQASYVNDISFSNEQVLMERAVNGSLGESVTGYSYGVWRESYSVEAGTYTGADMEVGTGKSVRADMWSGSGTYYYTGTGSVANLVTGSGTRGYSYGPGGSVTVYGQGSLEGRTNTQAACYGYNGEYTHGSLGLQYLRARYLKVETGTFTSRDTYAGRVRDILSQNRYTYAENNPVTFADPSGHKIAFGAMLGNMFGGGRNTGRNGGIGGLIVNTAQKIADKVASTTRAAQNTTRSAVNLATGNPAAAAKNQLDNVVAQAAGGITGTLGGGSPSVSGPGGMTGFAESVAAQVEVVRCQGYEKCNNAIQEAITYTYINREGETISNIWNITDEEFINSDALTQEEITAIIAAHNQKLIDMGLDVAIYEICHQKGLNPKVILATLGQEQSWGTKGELDKLFGVGPGGNPKRFDGKDFGGLKDAVDTFLKHYNDGKEMEEQGELPVMHINEDKEPYHETTPVFGNNTSEWQESHSQYVQYMERGVDIKPVNAAMYSKLKYTPWVDFPPHESTPLDTWLEIYNSF